jgi:transcriptional regulator with XRE-family HTH domain
MEIKDRLRDFRISLRMTQKDFALSIGVSQAFLCCLEHGRKKLSFNKIKDIKSVYPQLSIAWIEKGTGNMLEVQSNREMALEYFIKSVWQMRTYQKSTDLSEERVREQEIIVDKLLSTLVKVENVLTVVKWQ